MSDTIKETWTISIDGPQYTPLGHHVGPMVILVFPDGQSARHAFAALQPALTGDMRATLQHVEQWTVGQDV